MTPDFMIRRLPELLELFPDHKSLPHVSVKPQQPDYLYDAALSTMWNVGQNLPFGETFSIGRQMGFARVELNHAISPEMLAEIDFNQYRAGNVHDPCPAFFSMNELKDKDWLISSLDEDNRKTGVEVTLRTIDLGSETRRKFGDHPPPGRSMETAPWINDCVPCTTKVCMAQRIMKSSRPP